MFPNNTYDLYSIMFSIQNVTSIQDVLHLVHQVLKPPSLSPFLSTCTTLCSFLRVSGHPLSAFSQVPPPAVLSSWVTLTLSLPFWSIEHSVTLSQQCPDIFGLAHSHLLPVPPYALGYNALGLAVVASQPCQQT